VSASSREAPPFAGRDRIYAFADSVQEGAAAPAAAESTAVWETWVAFRLAGETFAFPVEAVQEILRVGTVTRVPEAPDPVRGILNMRGRVVPVVDLRVRLGLPAVPLTPQHRILVANPRGRVIGLLVDAVDAVERIDRAQVQSPPADVMTAQSEYLLGVLQRPAGLFILLDPERVLVMPGGTPQPRADA
jgi:purine-binding chemotaxis protein CheW